MPTAASVRAISENAISNDVWNRRCAVNSPRRFSKVVTPYTGASFATRRTAACTSPIMLRGSVDVRTSNVTRRDGFCASDSNICGMGSCSRPWRRMSPMTPTTVNQGLSEPRGPSLNRLPTGSCPGHKRRAIASLMMATFGPSRRRRSKNRGHGSTACRQCEKTGADFVAPQSHALGAASRAPFDAYRLFRTSADEELAGNRGALDTPDRFRLFEHAIEIINAPCDVRKHRARELHRHHAVPS